MGLKSKLRALIKTTPVEMNPAAPAATSFPGSAPYWEARYVTGGNSGRGSYGDLANYKARILNDFVSTHAITSVIEYGSGDGHQLTLAKYPSYLGFDVSQKAVDMGRELFTTDVTKQFRIMGQYAGETADLTMSLDVIYHLIEDDVFHDYMARLLDSSTRFVVVYASNTDDGSVWGEAPHVRHRHFSAWIEEHRPAWTLLDRIISPFPYDTRRNTGTFADFFFFVKG